MDLALKLFAPPRGSLVKIEDRSMEYEGAMQAKDSLDAIIAAMGAIDGGTAKRAAKAGPTY
jgi:hypothetical protein